jgi:hypothetical protein
VSELVKWVGQQIDRRRFLGRVAAVGAIAAGGLFGLAEPAQASHCPGGLCHQGCCCLCQCASSGCAGTGACTWCWPCCQNGKVRRCCEVYFPGGSICTGNCVSIKCSYYVQTNTSC